jgi:ABC-2 type transport system ATP-binding protein
MLQDAAAIRIQDLTVVRGGRLVLPGISGSIVAGKVTGLLGASGSGKTTLMRSIVGVQRIESGAVQVLGQPAGSAALRARVGYVTQAPSVYGDLSVRENLAYFARVLQSPAARIAAVIETVGLRGFEGQVVRTLSGGERSRVSLATALLNEPELLVLDEPTVGLDPVLRRDLWDTFHSLAEEGTTFLVSSHVMEEAGRCDELVLLHEGRIIAAEPPSRLLERMGARELDAAFLALVEAA